ncbi:MAG: ATPase AAA [Bacteroidia bacterium]|nr:MAG: ATPase AAA [Bacteroidia bacterium]
MLVDTLKSVFEAKKELFQGLYIYDKWDWNTKFPVIKIDFVGSQFIETKYLQNKLKKNLEEVCKYYELEVYDDFLSDWFREIILELHKKYQQKVVILIDEYDKPILDCITDHETAKANREILKGFYSVIKGADEYLRFVFLTGVSKFSKTSLFSGLNNLEDITLSKKYANICGYTHDDLLHYFQDYLQNVDLEEVKRWYNGYCWDIQTPKVYNPFDVLLFLENECQFKNYWFETGNPSFLIKLLQERSYYLPDLENVRADETLLSTFDVNDIPIEALLWQTGYLTIKNQIQTYGTILYELQYPNFEVEHSLNQTLIKYFTKDTRLQIINLSYESLLSLDKGELDKLEKILRSLFSGISYSYSQHIKDYEGFYGSVVYAFFKGLGLNCIIEDHTSIGRIDLTLKITNKIYIFEFKMVQHKEKPIEQIKKNKYYEKYLNEGKAIYLIGMVLDPENKNLTAFEWEKIK